MVLFTELRRIGQLERCGGAAYLHTLMSTPATAVHQAEGDALRDALAIPRRQSRIVTCSGADRNASTRRNLHEARRLLEGRGGIDDEYQQQRCEDDVRPSRIG